MFNFHWQWRPIQGFGISTRKRKFVILLLILVFSFGQCSNVFTEFCLCLGYFKKPLICYRVIFKEYNLKNHKNWIGICSEKYWIQNWNLPCHLMAFVHQDKFHVLGSTVPKLLSPFGILLAQCGLKSLLAVNIDIF